MYAQTASLLSWSGAVKAACGSTKGRPIFSITSIQAAMRKCLLFLLLPISGVLYAQSQHAAHQAKIRRWMDSLHVGLVHEKTDTGQLKWVLPLIRGSFQMGYSDSQILFAQKALVLAEKSKHPKIDRAQSMAREFMTRGYYESGRYPEALQTGFQYLQWAEGTNDSSHVLEALRQLMFTYNGMKEYQTTLTYGRRQQRLVHSGFFKDSNERKQMAFYGYLNFMGLAFEGVNRMDSALLYKRSSYLTALSLENPQRRDSYQRLAVASLSLGDYFFKQGGYDSAFVYYEKCIENVQKAEFRFDLAAVAQLRLATIYRQRNQPDSALHFAGIAFNTLHNMKQLDEEAAAAALLHKLYADRLPKDSAYKYLLLSTQLKDSLFNQEKIKQTEYIKYKEALRLQQSEQEKKEAQQRYISRIKTYGIAGGLLLLLFTAFFIYRLRQIKHETQLKAVYNKKIHQIEMRALRAQMNPHFIFNCLNSINRYIVKSDHKTASSYLTKFARLIRLILDNSASDLITLDKEIQTLQLYVDMEVLRFDQAFEYCIEVDEGILPETVSIPSMLLQPYVENAIWHGLLHREASGGKLWIRFRQTKENSLVAEIEDNGIGRQRARELKSKEVIAKKSYGMQISQDRIFLINELYNINANVLVDDLIDPQGKGRGTKVTVVLPATGA